MQVDPSGAGLVLAAAVLGYLVGSISTGYLVGRLYRNVDLRALGSGSTGATNTARILGLGAGALVAVLDIAKGALAVGIGQWLVPAGEWHAVAQAAAATGAVAGHCWPFTLQGRGGRGIAVGVGGLVFIASPALVVAVLVFGVAIALTRIVSVASLTSVVGAFLGYLVFAALGLIPFHWASLGFIVVGGAIVYLRHVDNIRRLLAGREPRVGEPAPAVNHRR